MASRARPQGYPQRLWMIRDMSASDNNTFLDAYKARNREAS
jgi:hypothetical protein